MRTIEITAKSEEEALELVKRELQPTESILSSEVLSAPAKGIFGLVGKPEYKVRFSIGAKAEEVKEVEEPETRKEAKTEAKQESGSALVQENRKRRDRQERYQKNDIEEAPEREKEEVTENITSHPEYSRVYELIKDVAVNVGIEDLELTEYKRDGAWVIEIGRAHV